MYGVDIKLPSACDVPAIAHKRHLRGGTSRMRFAIAGAILLVLCSASVLHAQPVTWKTAQHYQDYYIWGMSCADSMHCFAVASFRQTEVSMILRTTNGGLTWDSVYSERLLPGKNPIPTYVSVTMPTRTNAMVVADSGLVIRTTDGGATWRRDRIAGKATVQWIAMPDSMHALVGLRAAPNSLMATSDGGETWRSVDLPARVRSFGIIDLATPTPSTFIVSLGLFPHNSIIRSDDRGENWREYTDALPDTTQCTLSFVDSLTGWAAGFIYTGVREIQRAVIAKTIDGGATWTRQFDSVAGRRYGLSDIAFMDADSGLAVGGVGTVLRTTDGGGHWAEEPTDINGLHVLHVAYPKGSHGIIVTTLGLVALPEDLVSGVDIMAHDPATMLLAFPNPVPRSARLHVRLSDASHGAARMALATTLGQVVRSVDLPDGTEATLDLAGLPGGAYLLRVDAGGDTMSRLVWVGE